MVVVDKLLAEPLGPVVSDLVLLHVKLDQCLIHFEHNRKMLSEFVHPVGELVLRNWTIDVERQERLVMMKDGG